MYESWPQIHILEYFISSQVELEQFVGCWPVVEIIKQVLVNYRATENKKDGHAKTKRNVHTSFSSVIPLNPIVSARPASNASSSMSPPPSPKPRNVPPGATTHTIPSDGEEESDTEIHGMYDSDFDRQTAIMNEIYRKEALEKERKGTLHYFKQSSQVYS